MRIAVYYNATERHAFGGEGRDDVELFRDLLLPEIPEAEFIKFDAPNGEFPDDPTEFDGVILGGSAAMVADKEPWMKELSAQIRKMDAAKTKLWGICFGHQIIAQIFGGEIGERDLTIGAPDIEILSPQPWMHPYLPALHLYAGNFQQVTKLPENMRRLAIGRGNPNVMLAKDDHIVTLQFHPEFPHMFMEGYADKCFADGVIDLHKHQEAKKEIHGHVDSEIIAKWMAHFFRGK